MSHCVLLILDKQCFMETLLSLVTGYFSIYNMTFHHVHQHVDWILCNFSWKASFHTIITKGLHLIPIDLSAPHLKTVSKNLIIFDGK